MRKRGYGRMYKNMLMTDTREESVLIAAKWSHVQPLCGRRRRRYAFHFVHYEQLGLRVVLLGL